MKRGFQFAAALAALLMLSLAEGSTPPEAPRVRVDTSMPALSGSEVHVGPGEDLQAVLNAARPGDDIILPAGAVFSGAFVLPVKDAAGWIVIRSAQTGRLPQGVRVTPGDAHYMAVIEANGGPAIRTEPDAHNYRFEGIEFRPAENPRLSPRVFLNALRGALHGRQASAGTAEGVDQLVVLGDGAGSVVQLPHHIVFDRCYLHGLMGIPLRRGIAMNARYAAVVDSWLSGFKSADADSQALAAWNGTGPLLVRNNHIEAAGENVLFGGGDPSIPGLVPSDLEIVRNTFTKPLAWKSGEHGFDGSQWIIKNLLELKNARRVRVEGNLFQYNWPQAQNGFAILFTVRNQSGGSPWSVVRDVSFTNNVVRHVASAINILGFDDIHHSRQTRRILIRNNLFEDVGGAWGGNGTLFQLLDGTVDVNIEHNTALQGGDIIMSGAGRAHSGFVFRGNIVCNNRYGVIGTDFGPGAPTLARYFPGAVVTDNLIIGGTAQLYPAHNAFPATLDKVGFANAGEGNLRLGIASPYLRSDVDGGSHRPPGVDFAEFCRSQGEGTQLRTC